MSYGMSSPRGNTSTGANVGPTATGNMREKRPHGFQKASLQQYTPEQLNQFQSLFQHLAPGSYLSRLAGGDESLFNEMEAPALRQFSQLQGNIASRFSGMGMGGRHSSGFQNYMGQKASDFAQDLQARRQGLMQQAIKDLLGLSGELLDKRPFDQAYVEKNRQPSGWSKFGATALPIAGAVAGGLATSGSPAGITAGGAAGSAASRAFF